MRPVTQIFRAIASLALLASPPLAAQESAPATPATEGLAKEPAESIDPASSTESADQLQTILPADMTPDQLIQFFTLLSEDDSMETALAPLMEEMKRTGAPIENWSALGIDMLAHLEGIEGGIDKWLLRDTDEKVLTLMDFGGVAAPDLAPFQSYALRPEPVGLVAERSFASFLPGIWFEAAMQRTQIGNALCYPGYFGITLHTARPYQEWSRDEVLATATMFAMMDRLSSQNLCMIYDRTKNGEYVARAFTDEGRPLVTLDAQMTPAILMSAADLDRFLERAPSVAKGK